MVKMLTVQVEDALAKDIDRIVSLGSFSSRSEFLKDAIRGNIDKQMEREDWRKMFEESIKTARKEALANGWDGKMPSREERAKIADNYFKRKRIKIEK